MKKLLTYIASIIAFPFVASLERMQNYIDNQNKRQHDNKLKEIRDSYNVKFKNNTIWITHKGICIVPVNDAWTIDELRFEINRIITNSLNSENDD